MQNKGPRGCCCGCLDVVGNNQQVKAVIAQQAVGYQGVVLAANGGYLGAEDGLGVGSSACRSHIYGERFGRYPGKCGGGKGVQVLDGEIAIDVNIHSRGVCCRM